MFAKLYLLIRVFLLRKRIYLCTFLIAFSFAVSLGVAPAYVYNSLLPVPELPPQNSLIQLLQTSDEGMPDEISAPPVLGEKIAGFPVSDIRKIRPVHPVTGALNVWHKGFDVATPVGTPIYAPFAGKVTECRKDGQWGIYGVFESPLFPKRYWLLHHLSWCQEGPYVKGDLWAKTGEAGTGPHLHIEGWINQGEWKHYDLAKGWIKGFLDADTDWLVEP